MLISQTFEGVATLVSEGETTSNSSSNWSTDQEVGSDFGGEIPTPENYQ